MLRYKLQYKPRNWSPDALSPSKLIYVVFLFSLAYPSRLLRASEEKEDGQRKARQPNHFTFSDDDKAKSLYNSRIMTQKARQMTPFQLQQMGLGRDGKVWWNDIYARNYMRWHIRNQLMTPIPIPAPRARTKLPKTHRTPMPMQLIPSAPAKPLSPPPTHSSQVPSTHLLTSYLTPAHPPAITPAFRRPGSNPPSPAHELPTSEPQKNCCERLFGACNSASSTPPDTYSPNSHLNTPE